MAGQTVDLAVNVATTADVDAFDRVADSARSMGDSVESAANQADSASSKFDGVAASAENMDDKAGKATGALGALSSGFELVGADKAAQGLQAAAMATDFASGAAQAFTLVTELETVALVKSKVASAAHAAQTAVTSGATKAAAGAQVLFNAALAANPIGLVVVAIAALAAGLVIAYQKSDTFREVVDKAMDVAKAGLDKVVDTGKDVIKWIGDLVGKVDDIPEGFRSMKERVVGFLGDVLAPIQNIYDKVVNLIEKIKDIDLPKLPDLNPFRVAGGTDYTADFGGTSGGAADPKVIELLAAILAALKAGGTGIADPLALDRFLGGISARAERITA